VRVATGSDHAGYRLKRVLAERLAERGHEVTDLGTDSEDRVDYPDFGAAVGRAVAAGEAALGVCVCGSGIGMSIAANRHRGIRAALASDAETARLARQHNDANVLVLPGRHISTVEAECCMEAFLTATFEGGRHRRRLDKIAQGVS